MIGFLQVLPNQPMVVDFAVNRKHDAVVGIGEWLSSALCFLVSRSRDGKVNRAGRTNADDAEPFMAQNCVTKACQYTRW